MTVKTKTKDELLNEALQEDLKESDIFDEDLYEGKKKSKKEGENPFAKKDDDDDDDEGEEDEDDPIEGKKYKKEAKGEDDDDDDDDEMEETALDGVDNGDVEGKKSTKKAQDPKTKPSKAGREIPDKLKKSKVENLNINVEANVADLLEGTKFSAQHEKKISTIFESAVREQVKVNIIEIEKELEEQSKEELDEAIEQLEGKVEQYIDYVSKEYVKENKLAIEQGIRAELVENFLVDFKELCQTHNIEISDDQVDALSESQEEKESLETKLNEKINENIELQNKLNANSMVSVVESLSSGLVETDKEKFIDLLSDTIFINEDDYKEKLSIIREHYFNVPMDMEEDTKHNVDPDKVVKGSEKVDPLIAATLTRFKQQA